jgi:hypothetical protein
MLFFDFALNGLLTANQRVGKSSIPGFERAGQCHADAAKDDGVSP